MLVTRATSATSPCTGCNTKREPSASPHKSIVPTSVNVPSACFAVPATVAILPTSAVPTSVCFNRAGSSCVRWEDSASREKTSGQAKHNIFAMARRNLGVGSENLLIAILIF